MKTFLFLLSCPLAVMAGYIGGEWERVNPFQFYRLTPYQVQINENKKALKSVKQYKRQWMLEAQQSANPYIFGDGIIMPKHCFEVNAHILDCRNAK